MNEKNESDLSCREICDLIARELTGSAHDHWAGMCRADREDLARLVQREGWTINEAALSVIWLSTE